MSKIKSVLPKSILNILRYIKEVYYAKRHFKYDMKKYLLSNFHLNHHIDNVEARIMINLHSIEKGLTNKNFRIGFGKRALHELMLALKEYDDLKFDKNRHIFNYGLNILNVYIDKHKNTTTDTSKLSDFLLKYNYYYLKTGIETIKYNELESVSVSNFEKFSQSRSSVRDFGDTTISKEEVLNAIYKSNNTPSVCNRQPWNVHIILNPNIIDSVLKLQNGFNNHGNNLSGLILITSNNAYLKNYLERNQGYIDGGMFSMNVLYSLHSSMIASCPLNADLDIKTEKQIRELLKLNISENLIMFIAYGSYDKTNTVTVSPKKNIKNYLIIHE